MGGEGCASERTFESQVDVLSQPRVDPVRRRVFGDRVLLQPTAAGEPVEVLAGVNGAIHFTHDGPRCEEGGGKRSRRDPESRGKPEPQRARTRRNVADAAGRSQRASPASMHSAVTQNSSWRDF